MSELHALVLWMKTLSHPSLHLSFILPSPPLHSVLHSSPPSSFLFPAAHFTVSCFFLELRKRPWHSSAAVLQWVRPSTDVDEVPLSSTTLGPSSSPDSEPFSPREAPSSRAGCIPTLATSGACIRTETPTPTSLTYSLCPSLPLFSKLFTATYLISSLTKIPKWTSENNLLFRLQLLLWTGTCEGCDVSLCPTQYSNTY